MWNYKWIKTVIHSNNRKNLIPHVVLMLSTTSHLPHYNETKYIIAKKKKTLDDEARVHFISQTGWPGDPLPSGYISPQSAIRHQRVRGREIHQNSLCSVRYTKEPLRIRDGLLCLWLSTLRPIPSSPGPAWCELINHSKGLTWQSVTYTALSLHSLSLQLRTHQIVIRAYFSYTSEYSYFYICSFPCACIFLFRC